MCSSDLFGNAVYYFNVLREHSELRIEAQSIIEVKDFGALPKQADPLEWDRYNRFNLTGEHYDLLEESDFARGSRELAQFVAANGLTKPKGDPLTALKQLSSIIYAAFDYEVGITEVHSPIEKALAEKRGVCQDFAHIMIAIARSWGLPARYVSGYLYHRRQDKDRSAADATHAWVEVYLPSMGWVGFDPTNNILASERHLRVAAGRDYADVPPTRGTFKGDADSAEAMISISAAQRFSCAARTMRAMRGSIGNRASRQPRSVSSLRSSTAPSSASS